MIDVFYAWIRLISVYKYLILHSNLTMSLKLEIHNELINKNSAILDVKFKNKTFQVNLI